jgi:murein DD-endopeptidase MepM/ murein hydrolase activator NlpD
MQFLADTLLKYQSLFSPVVHFNPREEKLVSLDFTEKNRTLTSDTLQDITSFCRYIDRQLSAAKAAYGIGGYAEHRTIYSRSKLFDGLQPGEEPRRFHLGTDIWGKALTPVFAPLDGTIHSTGWNDHPGDYGATVILSHLLDGIVFYTLYGHLSLRSIQRWQEGNSIKKGEQLAEFGIPAENGQWPPHLHFQVISDMEGKKGDYPGVCRYSERVVYLQNCPDPDLILQMNRYIIVP